MSIKNKDGSPYSFTKPVPAMAEQLFWGKKEKVIMHNKFGEKCYRENLEEPVEAPIVREMNIVDLDDLHKQKEDQIKIVQAIEESKHKQLSEDVIEIWCLPCLSYEENVDPLYEESYAKVKYGDKFVFRSRLTVLEDLYIQFITELEVKIPMESVIYPKIKNRRWWRVKGVKESQGFNVYIGTISDYQPHFAGEESD